MNHSVADSLPTWRLWGEEHENDAIFTVYLKKVRYHRPVSTKTDVSDDEISHLEWETVRVRFVKAATLERLVDTLSTEDGELEATFINVFFSTYRTFTTPEKLMDLVKKRYEHLLQAGLRESLVKRRNGDETSLLNMCTERQKKSLVSALHIWLDGFPEDWNEETMEHLLVFASRYMKCSELHMKVLNRLERLLKSQVYENDSCHTQYPNGVAVAGAVTSTNSISLINCFESEKSELRDANRCQQYSSKHQVLHRLTGIHFTPPFAENVHISHNYRFPYVPVRHFAEQLTRIDCNLFKRLIPHQCLGATWARRDYSPTVVATINQFNAVIFRVISTILLDSKLTINDRTLIITTWIHIAQELRLLKNFSSLKSIVSALQSNSIYRLKTLWNLLPKDKIEIFMELARIFSEDNNAWAQREVLMREGTAKYADTVGDRDRHMQKIIQKQNMQISHGTIPYLGTFLTDLTMIHAAIPDTVTENNLINFDKKRKEFEVLAQIKLLQGAANTYNLREDPIFDLWFTSMPTLNEDEAYAISCQLERPILKKSTAPALVYGLEKVPVIGEEAFSPQSDLGHMAMRDLNTCLNSMQLPSSNRSTLSSSTSISNLSVNSNTSFEKRSCATHPKILHSQSMNELMDVPLIETDSNRTIMSPQTEPPLINAQLVNNSASPQAPNFYIIRVTYDLNNIELDGIVLYKSIMLANNERTPAVIRNAMLKLGLDGNPEDYVLAQILPDKELILPKDANVYYAVNTNYNLNFILRLQDKIK